MTNETFTILSKIDQPPYGIRQIDGSWKLFGRLSDSQDLFSSLEKLIAMNHTKKANPNEETADWSKLISIDVANYLSKYHPKLKLIDVSVSRDFILFSQIQAHNINPAHWRGGNAGSVQFALEDAKRRAIAEVIERTALSSIEQIIWASAVAPSYELAEFYAKLESIERWIMMAWWQEDPPFKITENIIPYFPDSQKHLIDAISFEWEPYHAHIQCVKVLNPFRLEVALAIVDAFIDGKHWRFYGNGLDSDLAVAAEKACLETLQFIPGPHSSAWLELEKSRDENDQRVFSWSTHSKNHLFSNSRRFSPEYFKPIQETETFYEKINRTFGSIYLKSQVIELQECSNVFVSYVVSSVDWRKERAVPIV